MHDKRSKKSRCLIRLCIVIYAVVPLKRATKEGRKQFDIIAEIESLEISLRPIGKYICRNCVAQLKKRRGLLEQLAKLEGELKSSHRKEDSVAVKRTGELPIGDQDAPAN